MSVPETLGQFLVITDSLHLTHTTFFPKKLNSKITGIVGNMQISNHENYLVIKTTSMYVYLTGKMDLYIFWIKKMCLLENSKHHDKLLWEECKQFLWRSKLHHSWKWVCRRLSLSDSTQRLEFLTFVHKWSGLFFISNILNMIYCPTV